MSLLPATLGLAGSGILPRCWCWASGRRPAPCGSPSVWMKVPRGMLLRASLVYLPCVLVLLTLGPIKG